MPINRPFGLHLELCGRYVDLRKKILVYLSHPSQFSLIKCHIWTILYTFNKICLKIILFQSLVNLVTNLLSCSRYLFPSRSLHYGKLLCFKFKGFVINVSCFKCSRGNSVHRAPKVKLFWNQSMSCCSLSRFTKSKISSLPLEGRMPNVSYDLLTHMLIKRATVLSGVDLNDFQHM